MGSNTTSTNPSGKKHKRTPKILKNIKTPHCITNISFDNLSAIENIYHKWKSNHNIINDQAYIYTYLEHTYTWKETVFH